MAELEKFDGITVKIEHLALGDYCIDGAVLIERKTATDFAQSLIDGRLFGQAGRMTTSNLRPAYIIEGTSAEWSGLAKRLLERFGTVRACFAASTAEFMEVHGIGPKTAAAIDHLIS